jgi:hypothetical protein
MWRSEEQEMKKTDLSNLSARIRIGEMDVRNRLVMPAMGSGFANEEGTPSNRMIPYYQRRAKGGAGLIIVELTAVHALGIAGPNGLRGHDVILYEKEPRLGGQVLLATKASYKKELESLVPYYVSQLQNLGVKVEIGKPMSAALAADIGPDVLVLATGSIPSRPDIPGVAQPNVLTARHVLEGKKDISGKVVILGAGDVGCETTEYLACRGLQVMILEMTEDFLSDMDPISWPLVLERLEDLRVRVILEATVTKISGKAAFYVDAGGEGCSTEADFFVLATGSTSQDSLSDAVKNGNFEFHAVGDCVKPQNVFAAISEGAHIARNLQMSSLRLPVILLFLLRKEGHYGKIDQG